MQIVVPVPYIESVNKIHSSVLRKKIVWKTDKKTKKKTKTHRSYADTILSDAARKAMHHYFSSLERYAPKETLPKNVQWNNLEVTYIFCLKQSFKKRDYDNMIKIFQDCLSHHLGFNDSLITNGHNCKKKIKPKKGSTKREYIMIKIRNNSRTDKELLISEEELEKKLGITWN